MPLQHRVVGVAMAARQAAGVLGELRAADLPAPAADAGHQAQPPHDSPCGILGVGITHLDRLAGVVAADAMDHGGHHALGRALGFQALGNVLAFGDQGKVVGDDAGDKPDSLIGQRCLAGMQRASARRTVVLTGGAQGVLDAQVRIAAQDGVGIRGMR